MVGGLWGSSVFKTKWVMGSSPIGCLSIFFFDSEIPDNDLDEKKINHLADLMIENISVGYK